MIRFTDLQKIAENLANSLKQFYLFEICSTRYPMIKTLSTYLKTLKKGCKLQIKFKQFTDQTKKLKKQQRAGIAPFINKNTKSSQSLQI